MNKALGEVVHLRGRGPSGREVWLRLKEPAAARQGMWVQIAAEGQVWLGHVT